MSAADDLMIMSMSATNFALLLAAVMGLLCCLLLAAAAYRNRRKKKAKQAQDMLRDLEGLGTSDLATDFNIDKMLDEFMMQGEDRTKGAELELGDFTFNPVATDDISAKKIINFDDI